MSIEPTTIEIGALVKLEEGSYYCTVAKRYIPISFCQIGLVIEIFRYAPNSYPWTTLGYKYLADIVIGPHRLRDVPDFKIYEVKSGRKVSKEI